MKIGGIWGIFLDGKLHIRTAFLSPQIGGTYSGNIDINWDPSSDANNDPITYNIYLKQGADLIDTLASSTSSTSISSFQTSSYPDGSYTLEGEVCDSVNPCVPFSLNGNFSISNTLPIQSLSEISISSSNPNTSFAKSGDTLTLTFLSTGTILNPEVSVYSGGDSLNDEETFVEEGNLWTYSYTVLDSDTDGFVTFSIMSDTLDKEYYETTSPLQYS